MYKTFVYWINKGLEDEAEADCAACFPALLAAGLAWLGLDRHLQLLRNLLILANIMGKVQLSSKHMILSPDPMVPLLRVAPNTGACSIHFFLFFTQTYVYLISAQSDRPGQADSQSTTYLSRVSRCSHAACDGGAHIWTLGACHLSVQRYVAATPLGNSMKEK